MKLRISSFTARAGVALAAVLACSSLAQAQLLPNWEAFNDHNPGAFTDPNATGHDMDSSSGTGLPLKNILTGADLTAQLVTTLEGADQNFGANTGVNPGSPAALFFTNKVTIGNDGIPGVRNSTGTRIILTFVNLDPAKRYRFRGTTSRGGGYDVRWSVFTLTNTAAYVNAHVDGSANRNIFTRATFPAATSLEPYQVALNSGDNKAGSLVGWDNIEPTTIMGPDGLDTTGFAIIEEQWQGPTPFGNAAAGPYGYGLSAIALAEFDATGIIRITENPGDRRAPAGQPTTFAVVATSSQPITYQWQKAPAGGAFADIAGATSASYTTPALTLADDGAKYRCQIRSGGDRATSAEAAVTVDGVIPTVTNVRGSINFNSVYISFSEPMKLDHLATLANYQSSGGLIATQAVALNPTLARLYLENLQTSNTTYTLTVRNVQDLAGNPVATTMRDFKGFSVVRNNVGVEIWTAITGDNVADLRNNERYPNSPDADYLIPSFNSFDVVPADPDLNAYGGRMRAWLTVEETGGYRLFLRADATAELRLLTETDSFETIDAPETPALATDSGGGDFDEPESNATTQEVLLERGRFYPMQVIWKEGNGADFCQVAIRKTGDETPANMLTPIPSRLLYYYGPPASVERPTIKIRRDGNRVAVDWTGSTLESSTDLKTWSTVVGAAKPLSLLPTDRAFYRSRN